MNNTVLLVVDVQNALVEGNPYDSDNFIEKIKTLILTARSSNVEVVYVRHDGGAGDELEKHTTGWHIYNEIKPLDNERIFDKQFCSAFKQTDLHEYLEKNQVGQIILVGMQTEYCIDTTCKVAFEYGYKVTIPSGATSTYDNQFLLGKDLAKYYEDTIWNNRFAQVLPIDKVIDIIKQV